MKAVIAWAILSEYGEQTFPRQSGRLARIVGESMDGRCWKIWWRGNTSTQSYFKGFFEILEPDAVEYALSKQHTDKSDI